MGQNVQLLDDVPLMVIVKSESEFDDPRMTMMIVLAHGGTCHMCDVFIRRILSLGPAIKVCMTSCLRRSEGIDHGANWPDGSPNDGTGGRGSYDRRGDACGAGLGREFAAPADQVGRIVEEAIIRVEVEPGPDV
jgi:hypothetical protein